jgi:hypothetical protein
VPLLISPVCIRPLGPRTCPHVRPTIISIISIISIIGTGGLRRRTGLPQALQGRGRS